MKFKGAFLSVIFLVACVIVFSPLCAQQDFQKGYKPFSTDTTTLLQYLYKSKEKLDSDLKSMEKHAKPVKEEFISTYNRRYISLNNRYKNQHFYTDEKLTGYFNNILKEILDVNPEISREDVTLLISRYPVPNAMCLGEGTLIFNISLLRWVNNESQVAFIICHELAHHYFNHVNNAIEKRILTLYSKETQKELKAISQSEYNRNKNALALLQGVLFEGPWHQPQHQPHHKIPSKGSADADVQCHYGPSHSRTGQEHPP